METAFMMYFTIAVNFLLQTQKLGLIFFKEALGILRTILFFFFWKCQGCFSWLFLEFLSTFLK
jgi:hypothetical protein